MYKMFEELKTRHRIWAEINLDNLAHNYNLIKAKTSAKIMPVIKADAYGHGAVMIALALEKAGALFFAVATAEEALQLCRGGITSKILLLGTSPAEHVEALALEKLTLCIPDRETAAMYKKILRGRSADVHIKVNTGMTRLGFSADAVVGDTLDIAKDFNVSGLFTHFAAADNVSENGFTWGQFNKFLGVSKEIALSGLDNLTLHAANSAALLAHPYTHLDYVRPGLALYGYSPLGEKSGFKPLLSLYSSIVQVLKVSPGETVSYGRTWKAERESVIATVPIGYADGYSRALSGTGVSMLVCGKKAPVVGRICMDFCGLDVTDIEGAEKGDVVTALGEDIDADEHARLAGTIPWEVLCSIGRRVPRVYIRGGKIIGERNELEAD